MRAMLSVLGAHAPAGWGGAAIPPEFRGLFALAEVGFEQAAVFRAAVGYRFWLKEAMDGGGVMHAGDLLVVYENDDALMLARANKDDMAEAILLPFERIVSVGICLMKKRITPPAVARRRRRQSGRG